VSERLLPRYPIYVPSRGRITPRECLTARFLDSDGVPFRLVVEAQQADEYARYWGAERLIVLPFRDQGLIAARNWIKAQSIAAGDVRHWQLDDNIKCVKRIYRQRRIRCRAGVALAATEDFVDRYENIAIAGLAYTFFGIAAPPFRVNCHIYSCTLVLNAIPHGWRRQLNDDTDLCLQVLVDGWCTLQMNAFLADKAGTMSIRGGNTPIYLGDGRLRMARSLAKDWPRVVSVSRRFRKPQHVVRKAWRQFDNKLRLKPGVDLTTLPAVHEYGMTLTERTKE